MREKKELVITINNVEDFEKLRNIKPIYKPIVVINCDINFKEIPFEPILAEKLDVIIKGNKHNLYNLNINNEGKPNAGLFSKVNSLEVYELNLINYNVQGGVYTGSLAGLVEENVLVKDSSFFGKIDCEAYGGGLVGTCNFLYLEGNVINTDIKGYDILGGVVGLANSVGGLEITKGLESKENYISTKHAAVGKAHDDVAGYISDKEYGKIMLMTKEAIKHLPPVCTAEEMKLLLSLSRKNR